MLRGGVFWSVLAIVLGGAAALALAAGSDRARSSPPTGAELNDLQKRINTRWRSGEFDRKGIFVQSTGRPVDRKCVSIGLLNPTAPHRAYLRERFGPSVCVERKPSPELTGCGLVQVLSPPGDVEVPDVIGLSVAEAERAIVRAGLRYSIYCLGDGDRRPRPPDRYSPDALAQAVAQCPHAGQRVASGAEVGLRFRARLPGGYRYRFGSLDPFTTGPNPQCKSGRFP
jgi:hypothetical protein